jgi:hypothetical protein
MARNYSDLTLKQLLSIERIACMAIEGVIASPTGGVVARQSPKRARHCGRGRSGVVGGAPTR